VRITGCLRGQDFFNRFTPLGCISVFAREAIRLAAKVEKTESQQAGGGHAMGWEATHG